MRFAAFRNGVREGLAVASPNGELRGLLRGDAGYPGSLDFLVSRGHGFLNAGAAALAHGPEIDLNQVTLLPPLSAPGKIICVGLNYIDHSIESGFATTRPPSRVPFRA